jgi:hypothetical protein
MTTTMEVNNEQDQMQTEVNALDAKQDDIGGFSFRFYLLKLRSKKNDWLLCYI